MMLSAIGSFSIYLVVIMPVIRICIALNTIETTIALLQLEEHVDVSMEDNANANPLPPSIDPIGCSYKELRAFYRARNPFLGFMVLLTIDWVNSSF